MSYVEWKDATSYSQGERGKIAPDAWECTIGWYRIWIGNGHIYHPGTWVVTCHELYIREKEIGKSVEIDAVTAQQRALSVFSYKAKREAADLTAYADLADAALIKQHMKRTVWPWQTTIVEETAK